MAVAHHDIRSNACPAPNQLDNLSHLDAGLSKGRVCSVAEVKAKPWQQAEDTKRQLVLGVPKQGSQALVRAPLTVGCCQDAGAGDESWQAWLAGWLRLCYDVCQLCHDLQQCECMLVPVVQRRQQQYRCTAAVTWCWLQSSFSFFQACVALRQCA